MDVGIGSGSITSCTASQPWRPDLILLGGWWQQTKLAVSLFFFFFKNVELISKTSTYNSSILEKMSKNDGKHKLIHKFLGFSVYLQLRGSLRAQGTKCHIFVGSPELQFSDRHSGAFCYSFSFTKVLRSQVHRVKSSGSSAAKAAARG